MNLERAGVPVTNAFHVRTTGDSRHGEKPVPHSVLFRSPRWRRLGMLYYRLGVFTIDLPPLRERSDALPLLVQHDLRRFSKELGKVEMSTSLKKIPVARPVAADFLSTLVNSPGSR